MEENQDRMMQLGDEVQNLRKKKNEKEQELKAINE